MPRNGAVPEPVALRRARGNPGKRPQDVDPTIFAEPEQAEIPAPDCLDAIGKEQWEKMQGYLSKNQLFTEVDGEALTAFCMAWSKLIQAEREFQEIPMLVVTGGTGGPIKNPLIGIIQSQSETVVRLCQQFGMTPAARAKIRFPQGTFTGKKKSKWEEFASKALVKGGKAT